MEYSDDVFYNFLCLDGVNCHKDLVFCQKTAALCMILIWFIFGLKCFILFFLPSSAACPVTDTGQYAVQTSGGTRDWSSNHQTFPGKKLNPQGSCFLETLRYEKRILNMVQKWPVEIIFCVAWQILKFFLASLLKVKKQYNYNKYKFLFFSLII